MISHDHEFVFVHVPKTGGSSFYRALGGNELDDPQHGYCPKLNLPLQHLTASELVEHGFLSPTHFNRYFKFCIVRNPWDLVVSEWKWRGPQQQVFPRFSRYRYIRPSLKAFLLNCSRFPGPIGHKIRRHLLPQYYFIHDSTGKQLVDHIGQFDNLADEFALIREKFNLSTELSHLKHSRNRGADYRIYYDDETYELVRKLYAIDIDHFGFEF